MVQWSWCITLSVNFTAKTQNRKFETNIPRKELRRLSPNFHIRVSVRDLYIPRIGRPILLQENIWIDPGNI
jgi:hypothetical protein